MVYLNRKERQKTLKKEKRKKNLFIYIYLILSYKGRRKPPLCYGKQELNNINKELNLGFKAHFLYFQGRRLNTLSFALF